MVNNLEWIMWLLLWILGGANLFMIHLIQIESKKMSNNLEIIIKYLELINCNEEKNSIEKDVMKSIKEMKKIMDIDMVDKIKH